MTRRLSLVLFSLAAFAQTTPQTPQFAVFEQALTAAKPPADPLPARVRVTFSTRDSSETVEAFWDGASLWRVRYSQIGRASWRVTLYISVVAR